VTYAQQQEPIWPGTGDQVVSVLLHRHWSGLHGLAVNMLRDRDAAQDAVQDAFIAIIRRRPVFDGENAAVRYARTAVLNNCRSQLRRLRTARKHLQLVREPTTGPADERFLANEATARMLAVVDALPAPQREVLVLRYFAHLDDHEIAATLGISNSAVRSTASRATAALSLELKGDQP
jgi:RNA polymerase sigma factor (sigma-70 family)